MNLISSLAIKIQDQCGAWILDTGDDRSLKASHYAGEGEPCPKDREETAALMDKQRQRYKQERAQLAAILKKTVRELKKKQEEFTSLQEDFQRVKETERILRQSKIEAEAQLLHSQKEIHALQEQKETIRESVAYFPHEESPRPDLNLAAALKRALCDLKAARSALKEIPTLQADLEQQKRKYGQTEQILKTEMRDLEQKLYAKDGEMRALSQELEMQRQRCERTQTQNNSLSTDKAQFLGIVEEQRKTLTAKDGEILRLQEALNEGQSRSKEELASLQDKLSIAERNVQDALLSKQLAVTSLERRIKEMQEKAEEASFVYLEKIDLLQSQVADFQEQLNTLKCAQEQEKGQIEGKRAKVGWLETQVERLTDELMTTAQQKESFADQLELLGQEREALQKQLDGANRKLQEEIRRREKQVLEHEEAQIGRDRELSQARARHLDMEKLVAEARFLHQKDLNFLQEKLLLNEKLLEEIKVTKEGDAVQFRTALEAREEKIALLQQRLKETEAEKGRLFQMSAMSEALLDKTSQEKQVLYEEVILLQQQKTEVEQYWQQALFAKEQAANTFQEQLASKEKEWLSAKSKFEELWSQQQAQFNTLSQQKEHEIFHLKQNFKRAVEKTQETQQLTLAAKEQEIVSLNHCVQEGRQKCEQLTTQCNALNEEKQALEVKAAALKSLLREEGQKNEQLAAFLSNKEILLRDQEKLAVQKQSQLASALEQMRHLEEDLRAKEESYFQAETDCARKAEEMLDLKESLTHFMEMSEMNKKEASRLEKEVAALKEELFAQKEQEQKLQQLSEEQLQWAEGQIKNWQDRYTELQGQWQEMQNQLALLETIKTEYEAFQANFKNFVSMSFKEPRNVEAPQPPPPMPREPLRPSSALFSNESPQTKKMKDNLFDLGG